MRVLVGMSGGIDSSAAALLLKEAGHEVIGVTMSIWREGNPFSGSITKDACFGPNEKEEIAEAKRISELIGIEYHVLDCAQEYEQVVLSDFRNEYLAGRTPNPCIWCNSQIKFGALPEIARRNGLEFDKFATGHYARVEQIDGIWHLKRGVDSTKDQTYFLYRLTQEQLSQVMFPLGELTKGQVRLLCSQNGLFMGDKKESQDFYSGEYSDLLEIDSKKGEIVDLQGNIIGSHSGYWNYTIGQRRGLKISSERPLYVISLDAQNNRVVVGHQEETFKDVLIAGKLNWIVPMKENKQYEVDAKIRSTQKGKPALITLNEYGLVEVRFAEGQKAVTPGQSVVFYKNESVLGGGVII